MRDSPSAPPTIVGPLRRSQPTSPTSTSSLEGPTSPVVWDSPPYWWGRPGSGAWICGVGFKPMSNESTATGDINVQTSGSGSPTLIFVHGFACDLSDWAAQVRALAADFSLISLDLPGHGASRAPAVADIAHVAQAVTEV